MRSSSEHNLVAVDWVGGVLQGCHIEELIRDSMSIGPVRKCFHSGEKSGLQVMLIAMSSRSSYRVHKHCDHDEWYLILKGSLIVRQFDEALNISGVTSLAPIESPKSGNHGLLVGRDVWHSAEAGDAGAIFLEVRPGPFVRENTLFSGPLPS